MSADSEAIRDLGRELFGIQDEELVCLSLLYFYPISWFYFRLEWSTYTQETQTLKWQNYCEI
jgi:hypothetical protein